MATNKWGDPDLTKRGGHRAKPTDEKRKVTMRLPLDVVEVLAVNKARGKGDMSAQVADLVREHGADR